MSRPGVIIPAKLLSLLQLRYVTLVDTQFLSCHSPENSDSCAQSSRRLILTPLTASGGGLSLRVPDGTRRRLIMDMNPTTRIH